MTESNRQRHRRIHREATEFFSWGPWLFAPLTKQHAADMVLEVFQESQPDNTVLLTLDIVEAALAMDVSAIKAIDEELNGRTK